MPSSGVSDPSSLSTFLFTDIEGSTRLWEQEPERMRHALACHDAIARAAVEGNRGLVVKTTGDGVHAAFDDPLDAVNAALQLQRAFGDPQSTNGIALQVRCGVHVGAVQRRDEDFYGTAVNRGARIMSAAHGGQVLVSHAVATLVADRLLPEIALRDLGSVRLRDLAQAERIYQVVDPELRADFPALRSLEATPNNLSHQITSFVGRERELAEVKKLLHGSRLVTLHGVGGLGKTRLSMQLAADVIDEYADGVWFVELAPITDTRLVPQAVASVLGVKEEAGRPVTEALVKFVKDRRLLLILDNCEHLTAPCAELAKQLLQAGLHVKIIATSRENLRVAGEALYPLPPLAAPEPHERSAAAMSRYEAVRLFVERATAAQPPFLLSETNATAVAEICRRLDGIPLALELAAARVRAMSVDNIAARLNDRFRLLRAGDQTALPRQQTLRALIDWSYDLLEDSERIMFRRLGVFVGGWTLEAAEAVCSGGELNEMDIVDLLTHLVEKSLVALDPLTGRYRLLETVRQYAQDRLASAEDEALPRNQHLEYLVALVEKARPALFGPDQGTWLARLDLEGENFLAAHAWCNKAESGAALGLRLVNAVKQYWVYRGYLALGYAITVEALGRKGAERRDALRSRAQFCAGQLCSLMGRHEEAQQRLEESLAIAQEIGDRSRVAATLQPLVWSALGRGDIATAHAYSDQALALAQELGSKRDLAAAINMQAHIHRLEGNVDRAEPLYETVLSVGRELGDRDTIAVGLLNLAMVAIVRGSVDRAAKMLLDVIEIAEEIGSKSAGQSALEVSAALAAIRQDWQRAARFYGAAEANTFYTGIVRDAADEAFLAPLMVKVRNAQDEESFADAKAGGRALSYEQAIDEVRTWLERRS
jgi:predicted ATPase/class 3 adenylate cyclase